jgi:hypothetical protein
VSDEVGEQARLLARSRDVAQQQGDNVVELVVSLCRRVLIDRVCREFGAHD